MSYETPLNIALVVMVALMWMLFVVGIHSRSDLEKRIEKLEWRLDYDRR